jgi:hypothetical protein
MPPPPVVRRDTTPESTPEQPIQSANCRRNDPGMTGSPPEPTPASAQHPPIPRMPRPPADEQARQFLAWLKARYFWERVFASHLKKQLYPSFCAQKGWQPRPWNTLAEDLKSSSSKSNACPHECKPEIVSVQYWRVRTKRRKARVN